MSGTGLVSSKTVLAVISLTQQRHVAEVENASLRSSLEETQLKLQESDASEERVLRMLHESQKELALLQQMQMESNRLNASLLVRLNVMRAQEADNLVSAETPESGKSAMCCILTGSSNSKCPIRDASIPCHKNQRRRRMLLAQRWLRPLRGSRCSCSLG